MDGDGDTEGEGDADRACTAWTPLNTHSTTLRSAKTSTRAPERIVSNQGSSLQSVHSPRSAKTHVARSAGSLLHDGGVHRSGERCRNVSGATMLRVELPSRNQHRTSGIRSRGKQIPKI
eukprot:ctg_5731.g655